MGTWSFSPPLPSSITTGETDGKLTINVAKNAFSTDTAYTVTYDDGSGCSATTKFYIKKNCSGGGGGGDTSGKCTVYVENESNTRLANLRNRALITLNNGVQVNLWLDGTKDSEDTFTIDLNDNKVFNNAGFMPYDSSLTLDQITGKPISTDCINRGDAEDPKTRLYQKNEAGAWTNLQDITTLSVVTYLDDGGGASNQTTLNKGGKYTIKIADRCPGSCKITGATLQANDYGAKTIGTLPNSGTWRFEPNYVDWLGNITADGTSVKASNVVLNTGEETDLREKEITATCTGNNCGECGEGHKFTVKQKGTRIVCTATGVGEISSQGGSNILIATYSEDCTAQGVAYVRGENFGITPTYDNGEVRADISPNQDADTKNGVYKVVFANGEDEFNIYQKGTSSAPSGNSIRFKFQNMDTEPITITAFQLYFIPKQSVADGGIVVPTPNPPDDLCNVSEFHWGDVKKGVRFGTESIEQTIPENGGLSGEFYFEDTFAEAFDWWHRSGFDNDTVYWEDGTPRYHINQTESPGCEQTTVLKDKPIKVYVNTDFGENSDTVFAEFKSGAVDTDGVNIIQIMKGKVRTPDGKFFEDPWSDNRIIDCY